MSMPWFRLYGRIIANDKLQLLAFEDRWHFIAFCCLKNDGVLDEPESDLRTRRIAVKIGVQVRELDEITRRLKAVDLIDETWSPVSWNDLQFKSDNSSERVKKYREKQQDNKVKRYKAVTVAAQEEDTDTDTEEEKTSCATSVALKPEHIVEKWNKTATRLGKPNVRDLTPERRQLLKARINQYSLDDFLLVFSKVESSAFLRGDKNWKGATFDWIFKKANFQKTLEGNYDE